MCTTAVTTCQSMSSQMRETHKRNRLTQLQAHSITKRIKTVGSSSSMNSSSNSHEAVAIHPLPHANDTPQQSTNDFFPDISEAANTLLSFTSACSVDCSVQSASFHDNKSSTLNNPYTPFTTSSSNNNSTSNDNQTNQSSQYNSMKSHVDTPSTLTNVSYQPTSSHSTTIAPNNSFYSLESSPLRFSDINKLMQGNVANSSRSSPTSFISTSIDNEEDNTTHTNQPKISHRKNNLNKQNRSTNISEGFFVVALRRFPPLASSHSLPNSHIPLITVQHHDTVDQTHAHDLTTNNCLQLIKLSKNYTLGEKRKITLKKPPGTSDRQWQANIKSSYQKIEEHNEYPRLNTVNSFSYRTLFIEDMWFMKPKTPINLFFHQDKLPKHYCYWVVIN